MEEEMDYVPQESYSGEPEASYTPEPDYTEEEPQESLESPAEPFPSSGDTEERIADFLDQISAGPSYGSMGDYYVAEAGCYAFPGEDVFFHFIDESARSGFTAAYNGCYVPVDSLEVYEAYLLSGMPEEDTEGEEQESLPPPVTQEDLAGLEGILNGIYAQEEACYEAFVLHMEATEKALEDVHSYLENIFTAGMTVCFFLALLSGAKLADVFWNRMRAG